MHSSAFSAPICCLKKSALPFRVMVALVSKTEDPLENISSSADWQCQGGHFEGKLSGFSPSPLQPVN